MDTSMTADYVFFFVCRWLIIGWCSHMFPVYFCFITWMQYVLHHISITILLLQVESSWAGSPQKDVNLVLVRLLCWKGSVENKPLPFLFLAHRTRLLKLCLNTYTDIWKRSGSFLISKNRTVNRPSFISTQGYELISPGDSSYAFLRSTTGYCSLHDVEPRTSIKRDKVQKSPFLVSNFWRYYDVGCFKRAKEKEPLDLFSLFIHKNNWNIRLWNKIIAIVTSDFTWQLSNFPESSISCARFKCSFRFPKIQPACMNKNL